jgi:hypothetical protein
MLQELCAPLVSISGGLMCDFLDQQKLRLINLQEAILIFLMLIDLD